MPIEKPSRHSAPVIFPETNYAIAKYLDLTKFLSLISTQSLFFSRLDKLEDHFEGTISKPSEQLRKEFYQTMHENTGFKKLSDEEIQEKIIEDYEFDDKMKTLKTVCCWNKYNVESTALWKIYSNMHQGIMIKSNINSLISAFSTTEEDLSLSEVKYINYNTDYMPVGNTMFPVIHKHHSFKYEEEIRVIYTVDFTNGMVYDWSKEKVEYGKYIKVDLNELIEEIIISPYSDNWYVELIKDLCLKYNIKKSIKRSEISR